MKNKKAPKSKLLELRKLRVANLNINTDQVKGGAVQEFALLEGVSLIVHASCLACTLGKC